MALDPQEMEEGLEALAHLLVPRLRGIIGTAYDSISESKELPLIPIKTLCDFNVSVKFEAETSAPSPVSSKSPVIFDS